MFTDRERATVVAALKLWRSLTPLHGDMQAKTVEGGHAPLAAPEIDNLLASLVDRSGLQPIATAHEMVGETVQKAEAFLDAWDNSPGTDAEHNAARALRDSCDAAGRLDAGANQGTADTLPPIAFSFEAIQSFEQTIRRFSREGGYGGPGYVVRLDFADGAALDAHIDCITDGGLCVREHTESDDIGPMHTIPLDKIGQIMVY